MKSLSGIVACAFDLRNRFLQWTCPVAKSGDKRSAKQGTMSIVLCREGFGGGKAAGQRKWDFELRQISLPHRAWGDRRRGTEPSPATW